jgi:hypothetical protein
VGFLTKIHGLWRHDGDTEPLVVSRRSFLFMGGVVAAGAMLPSLPGASALTSDQIAYAMERAWYPRLMTPPPSLRAEYLRRLRKQTEFYRGRQWKGGVPPGEWIFLDGKVPSL